MDHTNASISLLVGLKNNLRYSKFFYEQTRLVYPDLEICFVSYGSTDGTNEWLNSLGDENVKTFVSTEEKTLADAYNKATEMSTKDYVVYAHNDMIFAKDFIQKLSPHLNSNRIIAYTTVEPPVFRGHTRSGKIIEDFGSNTENFKINDFYEYSVSPNPALVTWEQKEGISFFICSPRKVLLDIGGLDNLFSPFFCEDDDLIRRLRLKKLEMTICLDALCYHFVSKTSRFSEEFQNITKELEANSNKNYIRKWGCRTGSPRYNIGAEVVGCYEELLAYIEPFFSTLSINDETLVKKYLDKEQPKTKIDLSKKFVKQINGSKLEIDANKLNNQDIAAIVGIMNIIAQINNIGTYNLGNMKLQIVDLEDTQDSLLINKEQ